MLFLSKKYTLLVLLGLIVCLGTGCQKDIISPANQNTAFVKYYGHIASQTGADLITTLDGGYIMVGSTNSYTNDAESDIFVVKTDSLGNEMWSKTFGRADGADSRYADGFFKFDEEGVRIIELPDGSGYTVAANRTYVKYASETGLNGTRLETKIALYSLDASGANLNGIGGKELLYATNDSFTEEISDIKRDTSTGNYIMTGRTTEISSNNPNIENTADVFTALYSSSFDRIWDLGTLAYGFDGEDYGTSVQILGDVYLVCGISEEKYTNPSTGAIYYVPHLLAVTFTKSNGIPTNPQFFGDENYHFAGGESTYDASEKVITVAAHIKAGTGATNSSRGQVVLFQVEDANLNIVTPSPSTFGCRYYNISNKAAATTPYEVESIALLPNRAGFILSSTYYAKTSNPSSKESNVCLVKFDSNLDIVTGWPYFFGYESPVVNTADIGGTVLPVVSSISGATQSELTGYAFTGTFSIGTNTMIGLIKVKTDGTLTP